jgi:dihydroxyacetone kinase
MVRFLGLVDGGGGGHLFYMQSGAQTLTAMVEDSGMLGPSKRAIVHSGKLIIMKSKKGGALT